MKKGTKVEKVAKYTKPIMVRFDEHTFLQLKDMCRDKQINEAVYCRKSVQLCLKKDLIDGHKQNL